MNDMEILIINPPFYRLQGEMLIHYPPGCCYIAAALEKAGIESVIYNADYQPDKKTILGNTNHINVQQLLSQHKIYQKRLHDETDPVWQEIRSHLIRFAPKILILSVFSTTLTAGNKIATIAKELFPNIRIIFEGTFNRGLHCAIDPSANGDFAVMDFAVRKDPESTVIELIQAIIKGDKDFSGIRGLSWKRRDGTIVHNQDKPYLQNLDALPFPARHRLLGFENMPPHCFQGIYGSRGCPFDCVFCGCHTNMGYKPRIRSAENMVEEIEHVYQSYGTRYFYICDDIFFIKKKRAVRFCELLIKKRLPVYFSSQTRAEMADDETFALVKKAGGQHIAVGVEVGNESVRELIKKGNTTDDVRKCAEIIHRNGLRMVAFCMVGLPWEGRREIEDTVNLIKEITPYIVYPYMPTPAGGTELAEMMTQKNPIGLKDFHDRYHIDPSAGISERMTPQEKKEVLGWAMNEFVKINRKSLIKDIWSRPGFYWALAHDMNFFHKPSILLSYIKDYLRNLK